MFVDTENAKRASTRSIGNRKCRPSARKSSLTPPGPCSATQRGEHKTAWNQLKVYVLWHRERNPRPKGRLILRTKNVKECVESICFWTQRTQKRGHQEHRQPKVWTVGRKIASAASGPCPAAQRRMLGLQRYEQPEEMKFLIWTS